MQQNLDADHAALGIEILGLNAVGHESGNQAISSGRSLPWLQDTAEEDAWTDWKAEWRDVIVVDADGFPVYSVNLTDNDLNDEANFDDLEGRLIDAAE